MHYRSALVCDENKTEKEIKLERSGLRMSALQRDCVKAVSFLFVSLYKCGIVYIIEEKTGR